MMALNQKRLLYAGVIFAAFILLTYGMNLTTLSVFLPTAGKEYQRGDIISFKTELADKVQIPSQWGAGCGDLTKGPCWTFEQGSFLQDDLLLEVRGIDLTPGTVISRQTFVDLRSSTYVESQTDKTRGYGLESGCIFNLVGNGFASTVVNCPEVLPVNGEARILKGTKQGLIFAGQNNTQWNKAQCDVEGMQGAVIEWDATHSYCKYTMPFEIVANGLSTRYYQASRSGIGIHVSPIPAGEKTGLNVEMQIVSLNEQADSMWVLNACVANRGVACTTTIEEVPVPPGDDNDNGVPDVVEDNNGNGVPDVIDEVLDGTNEPVSFTQNPLLLLAFAIIAYFASGFLVKKN